MGLKQFGIEVVGALLSLSVAISALGAEKEIPVWHKAAPGVQAFLGDDGGGAETVTVCDTADRYREWLRESIAGKTTRSCRKFSPYLSAVIEAVTSDPVKDKTEIRDAVRHTHAVQPIARVRIPSKIAVGYLAVNSLHPAIPPGTTLRFKTEGDKKLELHKTSKYNEEHGIDLGDHFSAIVIKYDPTNEAEWDLQVTILDGEHAGQSGWLSAYLRGDSLASGPYPPLELADAGDGHSVETFTNDVVISAVRTPFDCNDLVPHSDAYGSGDFDVAFKELQPLASERCGEAEHLLGVMYAQGRGVQKDLVQAYALLLLAYSDGMIPVGKTAMIPVLGDDEHELEIVQFGAELTLDQLDAAEALAMKLAKKKGKLADRQTADPTKVADSIRQIRPRVAGYKLNGEIATVDPTNVSPSLLRGLSTVAPDLVLTQVVTDGNANVIPIALTLAEMKLRQVGRGIDYTSKSSIDDFSASQGEQFAWLSLGRQVRIIKYAVNGGFAAQIELTDKQDNDTAGQRLWIDHCFLRMRTEADQALWKTADAGYCEGRGF